MRLYYFTKLVHAMSNLEHRHLKVSLIDELNDPYELFAPDLSNVELRSEYIRLRDDLAAKMGLVSMSTDWSLPIMWSHYADRHHGVCLGFDVGQNHLMPVRYADDRELLTAQVLRENTDEAVKIVLCTKHSAWNYEKEVRVFCQLNNKQGDFFFENFSEAVALKEVILGVRCPLNAMNKLRLLADKIDTSIEVFGAELSHSQFKVEQSALSS